MSGCLVLAELEGAGNWVSDSLWQSGDVWDTFFADRQFPSCYRLLTTALVIVGSLFREMGALRLNSQAQGHLALALREGGQAEGVHVSNGW